MTDDDRSRDHMARVLEARAHDLRKGSTDGILLVYYSEKWSEHGEATVITHLPMFPKAGDGRVRFLVALEKLKMQLLLEHMKGSYDIRAVLREILDNGGSSDDD